MVSSKSIKSPAFQFYPKDFFSSSSVQRMSMTERGIYITLLGHCWLDGSLPADTAKLARLCMMKQGAFERLWPHELQGRFTEKNGRLTNDRLEKERKVQADYRKKQKENADKGWQGRRNAIALPSVASESHQSGNAPLPHPLPLPQSASVSSAR